MDDVASRPVKTVGKRGRLATATPQECHQRAVQLQARAERLNPYPRPRGFVFKARSWRDYESWRQSQPNPRLW